MKAEQEGMRVMDEQPNSTQEAGRKETFTVAEAAALLGVTRQTIYNRLKALVKEERERFTVFQGKTLYMTSEGLEAFKLSISQVDSKTEDFDSQTETLFDKPVKAASKTGKSLQIELDNLKAELQEARAKASTLQATVTAQEAHIESLKNALDREQALHMASLQLKLPAGRGEGFFTWVKGVFKRETKNL